MKSNVFGKNSPVSTFLEHESALLPTGEEAAGTFRNSDASYSGRKERSGDAGSCAISGRGRHLAVKQQEVEPLDALARNAVPGSGQRPGDGSYLRRGPSAAALFALRFQRRVKPREPLLSLWPPPALGPG